MYQSSPSLIGVALSDRQVKLANTLGRMIEERHPGKGYKVVIHAYGYSRPAPVREIPADNVFVALAHGFLFEHDRVDVDSPKRTRVIDQFNRWTTLTKNTIWRPNIGDPACWKSGGPGDAAAAGEAVKMVTGKGAQGIIVDMLQSWWATQGPTYYVMARMAWNSDRNVADVLADYYQSGFGSAASDIRAYGTLMESAWREVADGNKDWLAAFTPTLFQRAGELLAKASANPALTAEEQARVAFVRAGFDYLRLNTASQSLVKEILAAKGTSPAIKERMTANMAAIGQLGRQHPEAFSTNQLQNPKGDLDYIHPEVDHIAHEALRLRRERIDERLRENAVAEKPNLGVR